MVRKLVRFLQNIDAKSQSCENPGAQAAELKELARHFRRPGGHMEKSLFDKYGGFSTVSKIVLSLYDRLLEDDDVGPFFDDVDLPRVIDHQTKFVSSLMGGPASFSDDHIVRAHRGMVIEHQHFDRLKDIVTETLTDFSVADEDIRTIVGAFESRRVLLIGNANVN